jgi:precorrin-6Y C5,15-methyltransferase (decarboxylating)
MFRQLMEAGLRDVQMMVLDQPAGEKERVLKGRLREMAAAGLTGDTICLFIRAASKGACDRTAADGCGTGKSEGNKKRELPKEIRSAVLAGLSLTAHDTVYVFGAGTGELAIEAAGQAALGTVYAFENREEELAQLRKNCAAQGAGNVQIISGNGLAVLNHLPSPDAVLVSGNPESVIDLIQICLSRNPDTGLVVVTHTFEKATAAAAQMEAKQLENEFLQITSCRAVAGKDGHEIAPGETAFIVSRIES